MYPVSEEYKNALRENVVSDGISGTVTLSGGTVIELSDDILVKNSLKITHELCGANEYKIGTFNLGCLRMSIFDNDALLHDFSGAEIRPVYEIETSAGRESVPLGIYTVDGGSVRRKRDAVTFTAYDNGILFDKIISDGDREINGSAFAFINIACSRCGVQLAGADDLPNTSVFLSLASAQVQTYRDLIAWCASLMCAYAVIDRDGALRIISAKYSVDAENTADIIIDKQLREDERFSVYSTDTRAYIRRLNAYCGKTLKTYVSDTVQPDVQAAEAVYTLPANPLFPKTMSEEDYDEVNESWLSFIDGFKQRGVTAEIYGDPAIDVGDTLRCSGGDIDQRKSIVGVVTRQEWRYRNYHSLVCSSAQLIGNNTEKPANVISQYEKKTLSGGASLELGKGLCFDAGGKIQVKAGAGLAFTGDGTLYASGGAGQLRIVTGYVCINEGIITGFYSRRRMLRILVDHTYDLHGLNDGLKYAIVTDTLRPQYSWTFNPKGSTSMYDYGYDILVPEGRTAEVNGLYIDVDLIDAITGVTHTQQDRFSFIGFYQ